MTYGDWAQWEKRVADRRKEGLTVQAAVVCGDCQDAESPCLSCLPLEDAWSRRLAEVIGGHVEHASILELVHDAARRN